MTSLTQKLSQNQQSSTTLMNNPVFHAKITSLDNPLQADNNATPEINDFKNEKDLKIGDKIKARNLKTKKSISGKIVKINNDKIHILTSKDNKTVVVSYDSIELI